MMDIVERLRNIDKTCTEKGNVFVDSANEIESLRTQLAIANQKLNKSQNDVLVLNNKLSETIAQLCTNQSEKAELVEALQKTRLYWRKSLFAHLCIDAINKALLPKE